MGNKKVLIAATHTGAANSLAPVIKKLAQDGLIDVVVVGGGLSERVFRENGIYFKTAAGCGLSDVSLDSMRQLIRAESPNLVFVGTSSQDEGHPDVIEQTLILAGREAGIKSLAVVDFWGNVHLRFSDMFTGEKLKFLPTKLAVLDKISFGEYLAEGVDRRILAVTGNPHFDNLAAKARNFTPFERENIRRMIGSDFDFLVFFAGSIFKSENNNFGFWDLDVLCVILRTLDKIANKKIRLAVKLHPAMPTIEMEEIIRCVSRYEKCAVLIKKIGTQDLILASDFTIVSVSTVGAEAVLMGKPCISLQPGFKRDDFLLSAYRIVPVCYIREDCSRLLERVIWDGYFREKKMPEMAAEFRTDGKATERVVKLVYEMLNN